MLSDQPLIEFARNPLEALHVWQEALALMERFEPREYHGILCSSHEDRLTLKEGIAESPVMFFGAETAHAIAAAARSYPIKEQGGVTASDIAESSRQGIHHPLPSWMPKGVSRAFAVFQRPTLFLVGPNGTDPLSALFWQVCVRVNDIPPCVDLNVWGFQWSRVQGYGELVSPVWHSMNGTGPLSASDCNLPFGTMNDYTEERLQFVRWVCTASAFVEQEICVSRTADIGTKPRRRTLRPVHREQPCQVVVLRRASQPRDGTSHEKDWAYQWIVRGHWRRQWFASRQDHVPMWIHAHVKGPPDKPLKAPKEVVYSVSR